jgi:hypothetical protein
MENILSLYYPTKDKKHMKSKTKQVDREASTKKRGHIGNNLLKKMAIFTPNPVYLPSTHQPCNYPNNSLCR